MIEYSYLRTSIVKTDLVAMGGQAVPLEQGRRMLVNTRKVGLH